MLQSPKNVVIVITSSISIELYFSRFLPALPPECNYFLLSNFTHPCSLPAHIIPINCPFLTRKPNFILDSIAFLFIFCNLALLRPKAVLYLTPKSVLLSSIAGWFLNIPLRINFFQGQHWVLKSPPLRQFYMCLDKVTHLFSTHSICMSRGELNFLKTFLPFPNRLHIVNNGSICGVDFKKISLNIRQSVNPFDFESSFTFLFVGRINPDKGLSDIRDVFQEYFSELNDIHFVVVGPVDCIETHGQLLQLSRNYRNFHLYDQTSNVYPFMIYSDAFIMPSRREGFGLTALEASACSLPIISTNIYGLTDVCVNNYNALVYSPGDIDSLYRHCCSLLSSSGLRKKLGHNGNMLAHSKYSEEEVIKHYSNFITPLLD